MTRDESGGSWLLAGLGLAGIVGGGYAVARTLRKPAAPPEPKAEQGTVPRPYWWPAASWPVRPAARASAGPIPGPATSIPAASTPVAPAVLQPKSAASSPGPGPTPVPIGPVASASKPAASASNGPAMATPFRRWSGPTVPPVPTDAPRGKLTRSTEGRAGTHSIVESPAMLLEQARTAAGDPKVSLDELAGARLAASELGNGSLVELAAIVDTEMNRAARAGRSLFESLTRGQGFGRQGQGSKRPASTRLDPGFRHLWAARAVLVGLARGISRDATAFFAPVAMDRAHAAWKSGRGSIPTSCDALGLLELWTFDRPRLKKGSACPFDASKVGRDTRTWVGPIEGVDPWRLMLMAPLPVGPEHLARYVGARAAILQGREREKAIV